MAKRTSRCGAISTDEAENFDRRPQMVSISQQIRFGRKAYQLARWKCSVTFDWRIEASYVVLKDGVDAVEYHDLCFEGTELFMCTYLSSLTPEMTRSAYGKLVDLGRTELRTKIAAGSQKKDIRHLMICFDDGPCYEVVCTSFSHSKR